MTRAFSVANLWRELASSRLRDSVPVLITRKSGHYLPTEEQLFQVRDMLSEQGIDVSRVIFGSGF